MESCIESICEFQSTLRSLTSANVVSVKDQIVSSVFSRDDQRLREIAHEFVFLPTEFNIDLKTVAGLLVLLNGEGGELSKLKSFIAEEIINPSKDANNIAKSGPFRLLRYCYLNGLYNDTNIFDYVQRFPKSRKTNCFLLFCFLAPEIQQKSPELFARLKSAVESFKIADKCMQSYISNFDSLPLMDLIEYGCEKNSPNYQIQYGDPSSVADDEVLPFSPFSSFTKRFATAREFKDFLEGKKAETQYNKATFIQAATNDDVKCLLECIEKGINVNGADSQGMTALHFACSFGHLQCVRVLVEKGATINKKNDWGETCLHYAAKNGSLCTVEFLVTKGGDIFAEDSSRWTPFIDSVESGSLSVSIFLATKGSDMNRRSRDGKAPLHIAALNGDLSLCEFLVMNGASIDSKDDSQKTALHIAAIEGHINIIEFLCSNSAEKDIRDLSGRSAIHFAAFAGHVDVVESLVDHGVDVDCADNSGSTPLMLAASSGHLACVECLVFKGADIYAVDNANKTALDLCTVPEIRDYIGSLV